MACFVFLYLLIKVCCTLAELSMKSVYLNLFGWIGGVKFMNDFEG
jgi:hypothetical protein